jgi:Lamin Tail Domain
VLRSGYTSHDTMNSRVRLSAPLAAALCLTPALLNAQVVINEIMYDDTGTDDREFVELYNAGTEAVDISGWTLGGYDVTTTNPSTTIPASTTLSPGGFYVIGNAGVLNLNHSVAVNFLENDNEAVVLRNSGGVLVDAVAYETNKGAGFITSGSNAPADAAAVAVQVGPGIFGNSQGIDIAGTPFNTTVSLARLVDGKDNNNNGRDFALRPGTPGSTNNPGGLLSAYSPPDPASFGSGTAISGMTGSFVPPRVIDPAVADTNNPNVIAPPHEAGSKAYVMWDPSGGGNCATSTGAFATTAASFSIRAYFDTADLPVQSNVANVQFRGSEITIYGLGSGDALTNLTDLDGSVGLGAATLPLAESANGFTGVAWIYERVAADPAAPGVAYSEKLYLVDANDGGDSDLGGNTPLDWTILATYNFSATPSGWHNLSISIDAAGNGMASFDGQTTAFTTAGMHSSAFNVGYRENLQMGADATPDALLRPATFTFAPSVPAAIGDLAFAASTPGARNLTIPVTSGQTIGIFYSTDLAAGSWMDLGNVTVSGANGTFSDTDAGRLANPRGFYRATLR